MLLMLMVCFPCPAKRASTRKDMDIAKDDQKSIHYNVYITVIIYKGLSISSGTKGYPALVSNTIAHL